MTTPCILAIDAATGPCSVAVWREGRVAAYREHTQTPAMQSAVLMPMVEAVLAESNTSYSDLTTVAATVGPGSFTGIRVALAAARGITFAARIPGWGFTTLEVMAFAARDHVNPSGSILSILNAGKGECYYQYFDVDKFDRAGIPDLGPLEDAIESMETGPVCVAGNVTVPGERFTASPVTFPRADALAGLAAALAGGTHSLKPFYIRAPDAKLPVKNL